MSSDTDGSFNLDAQKLPADSSPTGPEPGTANLPLDPFNLENLKLSQDFSADLRVKKVLTQVPVGKPSNEPFVRVHPDAAYCLKTNTLQLKNDRESYLVAPELWNALAAEPTFRPRILLTTITRHGTVSIWQIRLPGPDGKIDSWNNSALEAAEKARHRWVRVISNSESQGYDTIEASEDIPPPIWPDVTFQELIRIAFKNRYIDSIDHPVLRRLRGEI